MSETIEALLGAAETRMRAGGYHAVSFRDLADDLGIKSASVHYHFRRKEDLGAAVVERYGRRFMEQVAEAAGPAPDTARRISAVCDGFRAALHEADQVCLCGVLGAEALGLPKPVRDAVAQFMGATSAWIAEGFEGSGLDADAARAKAWAILATLEGAMILAVSLDDTDVFEAVVSQVRTG